MRSVTIVVGDELALGAKEVPLTEDDEVIEQLAPQGPDEAFGVTVLPR